MIPRVASPRGGATSRRSTASGRPWIAAGAVLVFVGAALVVARRTFTRFVVDGNPAAPGWGFADFRDAIYYPVVAFLDGDNPYDPMRYAATYPVGNVFPAYTPVTLLVHLPFGLLPFVPSAVAYFLSTLALYVWLAYLTLRMCRRETSAAAVFGIASAILISQPGQWNLFLGQSGAPLALAVYGALHLARDRPWLSGLCFAVASFKPTTGAPLALLMLARGDRRAVAIGVALAAGLAGVLAVPIVYGAGGVAAFLESVRGNYTAFVADPTAAAHTSPYRVDVAALASRLLGRPVDVGVELALMLGVLGLSAAGLRRLADGDDDQQRLLSASLVCVALLVCVYHQSYEASLLALPLLLTAGRCLTDDGGTSYRHWVLLAAAAVPAANYLVMGSVVNRMATGGPLWLVATSLDGVALLVALCVLCSLAFGSDRRVLEPIDAMTATGSLR